MRTLIIYLSIAIFFITSSAAACDLCALYTASALHGHKADSVSLSINEQYTKYSRGPAYTDTKRNAEYITGFSTTQFGLGYDYSDKLALQFVLPVIIRRFDQVKDYTVRSKTDAGIGDIVLGGNYSFLDYKGAVSSVEDLNLRSALFVGVKFPTGDSGSLDTIEDQDQTNRHHTIAAANGDRALAYGSGSYDVIFGLNKNLRFERYQLNSGLQYSLNNEGDFQYEFHDSLIWSLAFNYFAVLEHDYSVAPGLRLGFEYKGKDRQYDQVIDGTEVSNWFLGPELLATVSENLFARLALEFRVSDADQHASIVPSHRILASVACRF